MDAALSLSRHGRATAPLLSGDGYLSAMRTNDDYYFVTYVLAGSNPQLTQLDILPNLAEDMRLVYESANWEPKEPKSALELLAEQSDEDG